jgi:hypothetical protein
MNAGGKGIALSSSSSQQQSPSAGEIESKQGDGIPNLISYD